MSLLFPRAEAPSVDIRGMGQLPIHRIFCVGRNYAEHAAEMGGEVDREAPFYFLKSAHSAITREGPIPYPPGTQDLHHEVELVAALGESAEIIAYGVGLDMTRRDLQARAKEKRRPWDLGKDFEGSAILGTMRPARDISIETARIALTVNRALRQEGRISDMVWSLPEIVADLSKFYTLQPGDLIMTGTPAGVGAVVPGDRLDATIDDLPSLRCVIEEPA
ncbi:fumarylpyruvate hydrolase [Palleronia aestuarii]|uniref:Fumarylpyruvate hydrolase n=1 Tax=Palleronia aestuarii TaxID=568105 RepID=A0A2W7N7F5_9RHOB|nr:fumarylacetoacetate hydrolase family protein [Palleronia aestuarii]PZX15998.1 fumarylpyruvate hydrolase [Palleronia aestuarii]